MKRSIVLLTVIVCIAALCACSSSEKKSRRSSDDEGDIPSVEEYATDDKRTDDTPTPSPVPTETTTPTPAPSPKPEVKVEDAHKEVFNINDRTVINRYPKISISGVDTSAVNQTIEKDLKKSVDYVSEYDEYYGTAVDYEYYIGQGYISVMATLSSIDVDYFDYKVYNISVETGQFIDGREIVFIYGISDGEFFKTVKEIYKKFGGGGDYVPANIAEDYAKQNMQFVSYSYITPYSSSNGHLCFIGHVLYDGGAGEGNCRFDVTDVKPLGWGY